MSQLNSIVARLEQIDEELSQLAIDCLTASITNGDAESAAEEKRITRARRAVEKAAGLLAGMPTSTDD